MFKTAWPAPRKRWSGDVKKIGVYAIVYEEFCYVGMTVSVNGFQSRWAKHHRNLFVKKRMVASEGFKHLIKGQGLTSEDFELYALRAWAFPESGLPKDLVAAIALAEREEYDRLEAVGFTMLNGKRPTGSGYVTDRVLPAHEPTVVTTEGAAGVTVGVEVAGEDAKGLKWRVRGRVLTPPLE